MKPYRTPASFNPCLWSSAIGGELVLMLVCADSQRTPKATRQDDGGIACDEICHPVAIRLGAPAHVHYGFKIRGGEWHVCTLKEAGIPQNYAQRALAEAWRGVEGITQGEYPKRKWNFSFRVNAIRSLADCERPQEQTMFRNVNLWIRWGLWEDQNASRRQRALELTAMGIPTDEKKINKVLENAGL